MKLCSTKVRANSRNVISRAECPPASRSEALRVAAGFDRRTTRKKDALRNDE